MTSHYEKAVRDSGVKGATAGTVVCAIAREVEKDGVLGAREANEDEAPYVISFLLSYRRYLLTTRIVRLGCARVS